MLPKLPFKSILTACLVLLLIACNNDSSSDSKEPKTVKVQEVNLEEVVQEEPKDEPPPPPPPTIDPPKVEMKKEFARKCFTNEGLKYTTTIKIIYLSDSTIVGQVSSLDSDGDEKSTDFEGTVKENIYSVSFKKDPPLIGDASEWTKKGWRLETKNGKETLRVAFNAKNYYSNKWKDTDYEFEPCNPK